MLLEKIKNYACLRERQGCQSDKLRICRVTSDSRYVGKGDLFVAIDGLHSDGHQFVREAIARGAAAAVVAEGREEEFNNMGIPILSSKNTRKALSFALDRVYGCPSRKLKIIAVTGTNGKTTIAHMIDAVLRNAGLHVGLIGSVGTFFDGEALDVKCKGRSANMTTPDPEVLYYALSKLKKCGAEYVVMEASSHSSHFDKLSPLYFIAAVFSNLSQDHLDLHKSEEAYFNAKREILRRSERAIINIDDSYGKRLVSLPDCKVITVGRNTDTAFYKADDIVNHETGGFSFLLKSPSRKRRIAIPLDGEFNVENALLAAALAHEIGIPLSVIASALECFKGVPGRAEKLKADGIDFDIYIDYAHTVGAFKALLGGLTPKKEKGRIIAVYGCGGDRDKDKRPIIGKIVQDFGCFSVLTSDNSRSESCEDIINDIIKGFDPGYEDYKVIKDRKDAIEYAINTAESGDTVLLIGKGHEKYEIDKYGQHPFDEKAVVRGACIRKNNSK